MAASVDEAQNVALASPALANPATMARMGARCSERSQQLCYVRVGAALPRYQHPRESQSRLARCNTKLYDSLLYTGFF